MPTPRSSREPGPTVLDRVRMVAGLAETWWRRPATPTRLVLDVTRRCNLRCAMCRTWERPHGAELDAAEIAGVLRRLHRLRWLDITGGEPFVRSDIAEILAAAAALPRLSVLHFQTNGWFVERIAKTVSELRRSRLRLEIIVTVSIDGPGAVHDQIRGRAGSFARAVATAAQLTAIRGVDVHLGTTVSTHNLERLADTWAAIRAALPDWPRDRWHWNAVQRSPHFFANADVADALRVPLANRIAEHIGARGVPRSLTGMMELAYLVNLAAVERGEPSGIACQSLRSAMFIAPEGDVYPCHIYDRPLGNVRTDDVLAIWNAAATRAVRRDIDALACGGCFSACEAYPAMAGAPLVTISKTARRALALARGGDDARR